MGIDAPSMHSKSPALRTGLLLHGFVCLSEREDSTVDDSDIGKIEKIIEDRKMAHAFFGQRSKTYRAFDEVERIAFRDGRLTRMQKELIATGISVVINCESCMECHITGALREGATTEDVLEAIDVAIEMGGGPATVAARFAAKVLKYREEKKEIDSQP